MKIDWFGVSYLVLIPLGAALGVGLGVGSEADPRSGLISGVALALGLRLFFDLGWRLRGREPLRIRR